MFLTCILSKNIVLTSWILKFQTLIAERKACYTMVIVIVLMLYSDFHPPLVSRGQHTLNSTPANGELWTNNYHHFGLDSEIQSVYLKIHVKAINFRAN